MFVRFKIAGTQSLALAESQSYPNRAISAEVYIPNSKSFWLSTPTAFLGAEVGPRGYVGHRQDWSEIYGRQQGANCKHKDKNKHSNTEVNEH